MKLLILIIGLSLSSNCAGQIPKSIINIVKGIAIAENILNGIGIADKIPNIHTPRSAYDAHEKTLVFLSNRPNFNSIKIQGIIKNSIPNNKPNSIPKFQQSSIENLLKFKDILPSHDPPVVLTSLTALSLPSSSIFHLIATKNPLYPDYKGFTFTKTISYFSFNNKNFND